MVQSLPLHICCGVTRCMQRWAAGCVKHRCTIHPSRPTAAQHAWHTAKSISGLHASQAHIKDELGSEEEQASILLELGRLTDAEQIYRSGIATTCCHRPSNSL